ncbi:hypothetical protein ACFQGR_04625 [Weissella sagaensis]|uniref:Uncharacterized protein n=1 Tax=Weissella sagaensis TaxID=2559928 RepID=A0ABW1RTA1_9LACO|nr:hypothetical protein [Weissella sagaensis]
MTQKTTYLLKINGKSKISEISSLNKELIKETRFNAKSDLDAVPDSAKNLHYNLNIPEHTVTRFIKLSEEISLSFVPVDFTLQFRKKDIWKDEKQTQIKDFDQVIGVEQLEAAFFELDKQLWLAVYTSKPVMIDRVRKLLGLVDTEEENITPELFRWLFYLFDNEHGILREQFIITDMMGFTTDIINEQSEGIVSGTSDTTAAMSATKLEISLGHPLKSVKLGLKETIGSQNVVPSSFVLESNYKLSVDTNWTNVSKIYSEDYKDFKTSDRNLAKAVYIYAHLIPEIKELYLKNPKIEAIVKYRNETIDVLMEQLQEAKEELN